MNFHKKINIFILGIIILSPINSLQAFELPSQASARFELPHQASEIAEGVFSLGFAYDIDGTRVEGFAFIHPKDNAEKPPGTPGGGGEDDSTPICYSFIADGVKWETAEPYLIDDSNLDGLTREFIRNNIMISIAAWEDQVTSGVDIFGSFDNSNIGDGADTTGTDGKNEISFAPIDDENVIAVTITWGIFRGPPSGRKLVEWDMVFSDTYNFGDSLSVQPNGQMDFRNIATHEIGHAAGMGHAGSTGCEQETMAPTAAYNETSKRTLEQGDIDGINVLYP